MSARSLIDALHESATGMASRLKSKSRGLKCVRLRPAFVRLQVQNVGRLPHHGQTRSASELLRVEGRIAAPQADCRLSNFASERFESVAHRPHLASSAERPRQMQQCFQSVESPGR